MASESRSLSVLAGRLAEALPKDAHFTSYHVSTPPSKHGDIFAAPPDRKPRRAYCESQFLTVAVRPKGTSASHDEPGQRLLVFAMEVLVYTTAQLTTLFVSKADSTGYIHDLGLPQGTASPLKTVASTFLSYLVDERQRPGVTLMVSLFARAQDQYLFPGSVENAKKHVLDDRGLIKWWCRVLDHLLTGPLGAGGGRAVPTRSSATAYAIVPGLDKYETSALFPASAKTGSQGQPHWVNGHPLRDISISPNLPPRCLIPRFPDDPKARYMDELDEELPETSYSQIQDQPSKQGNSGHWRSIQTLEHFWEAMEFRQECSSGRSVGFIWVVFNRKRQGSADGGGARTAHQTGKPTAALQTELAEQLPTPQPSQPQRLVAAAADSETYAPPNFAKSGKPRGLTGPIIPRQPRIKTSTSSNGSSSMPVCSKHYLWPTTSRGQIVLDEKDYKRVNDLLLRLAFASHDAALQSTQRWVEEVAVLSGRTSGWGEDVIGTKQLGTRSSNGQAGSVHTLGGGLVRKKRKDDESGDGEGSTGKGSSGISTLSAGLVRKKPKNDDDTV